MSDETLIDWNECVPWDGEEGSLPLGEQSRIPNFRAIDLVKRWEVLDVESDEGFKVVKKGELKPTDKIVGAQINENAVNAVINTYGPRFVVFRRADGTNEWYDRWQWYEKFGGVDVLELEALKQIRQRGMR